MKGSVENVNGLFMLIFLGKKSLQIEPAIFTCLIIYGRRIETTFYAVSPNCTGSTI